MKAVALVCLMAAMAPPSAAGSQEAQAVVRGPQAAVPGDLVVLDATESQADCFHWVLLNSKKAFLPMEGGRKLVFASGTPQEYVFVLVVGAGSSDQLTVDIAEHRIVIGTAPPPPPDIPTPDLPDGKWGFAAAAFRWVRELVPPDKRHYAGALALNFESQAAAIEAGAYDQPPPAEAIAQANLALRTANRQTLRFVDSDHPGDADAWTRFFAEWKKKADVHNTTSDGSSGAPPLKAVRDYGQAYEETAAGLKAAAAVSLE